MPFSVLHAPFIYAEIKVLILSTIVIFDNHDIFHFFVKKEFLLLHLGNYIIALVECWKGHMSVGHMLCKSTRLHSGVFKLLSCPGQLNKQTETTTS